MPNAHLTENVPLFSEVFLKSIKHLIKMNNDSLVIAWG